MAINHRQLRWVVLLGAATTFQAQAIGFDIGPISGTLNTQLSLGATLRTEDPEESNYAIANSFEGTPGLARSANGDDGNLPYASGDFTSVVAASSHEVLARWENFAFFTRFGFAYDFKNRGSSSALGPRGESLIGRRNDLLDLFVQGRFRVFDRSLSVRVGRQVVSWGESTFIQNGINVINAIDVSKFRTPGSRLRDALLPSPMVHLSYSLTRNLSMEALYIAAFDEIEIDPNGAFFSTNDFASEDGDKVFLGFGRRADDNRDPIPFAGNGDAQFWIEQAQTRKPDGDEQYGLSFRYIAPWLNSTEFGFYYLNYDSRLPLISAIKGQARRYLDADGNSQDLPGTDPNDPTQVSARYFVEYPENIDLFGVSFNTLGPLGIALQGEYSYRPNLPLQLAAVELLLQSLDLSAATGGNSNIANNVADARGSFANNGDEVRGWERVDAHQWQVTGTQALGPQLGASQFILLGEVGVNYLELPDGFLFNGPGTALPAAGTGQQTMGGVPSQALSNGDTQPGGYATSTSYGYRVLGRLDYDNVFSAANVSPRLIFAHDVSGVGPNFTEGQKAIIVGANISYLQRWAFDISYTNFFGGRTFSGTTNPADPAFGGQSFATSANANEDRDFISANISYSF